MNTFRLRARITISLLADVEADSLQEAIEKGEDMGLTAIFEDIHLPRLDDGDWHTSGELDGTPFDIESRDD